MKFCAELYKIDNRVSCTLKTESMEQCSRGGVQEAKIVNEQQTGKALTVDDVRQILKIGSNTAYNLIHSKAFPVKKIGHTYRIPADSFYHWLEGEQFSTGTPGG